MADKHPQQTDFYEWLFGHEPPNRPLELPEEVKKLKKSKRPKHKYPAM